MFEDLTIGIDRLRVRLAPAVLGRFEPASGIMVLNVSDEDFTGMLQAILGGDERSPSVEVFQHEMCHCFQTYCTGYLFHRVSLLRDAIEASFGWRTTGPVLLRYFKQKLVRWGTAVLPRSYRERIRAWYEFNAAINHTLELQEASRRHKQHTLIGTLLPDLYTRLTEVAGAALRPGRDGLSANDVLEGSAVGYAALACHGRLTTNQLLEHLSGQGETYTRAIRTAQDACGDRAASVLLPATALALRYEYPGNAYLDIVRRIADAAEGQELACARTVARALPSIEGAGRILGTAVEVRPKIRRPSKIYATQMTGLKSRSWGIDELDLLTDPSAIGAIPPGELGFGVLTQDGPRGLPDGENGRLVIAALMLRGGPSVPAALREIQESWGWSTE